jgi:putative polyhydroxyalkanoate system protein
MTNISISHPTTVGKDKAKDAITEVFKEISKKYNLEGSWRSDTIFDLTGPGIEGFIQVLGNSVDVSLTLGGFLATFSKAVDIAIRSELQEKLP